MTDEFATGIRVGTSLGLLVGLVCMAAIIYKLGISEATRTTENVAEAFSTVGSTSLLDGGSQKQVSAPVAYKLIQRCTSFIDSLEITYKDGTVTSDVTTLLQNADKKVRLSVSASGAGTYRVKVFEI